MGRRRRVLGRPERRVLFTIAGSDSAGRRDPGGPQDVRVVRGVGHERLTGVTAQNTLGVHDALVLPGALVRAQIDAVVGDLGVAAAKTGMLGSAAIIETVAAAVERHGLAPLIVDPVLVTSHGELLLEPDGLGVLRRSCCRWRPSSTPNCRRPKRCWAAPSPPGRPWTRPRPSWPPSAPAPSCSRAATWAAIAHPTCSGTRASSSGWMDPDCGAPHPRDGMHVVGGRLRPDGAGRGHPPGLPPGQGIRRPRHRGRPGRGPGSDR